MLDIFHDYDKQKLAVFEGLWLSLPPCQHHHLPDRTPPSAVPRLTPCPGISAAPSTGSPSSPNWFFGFFWGRIERMGSRQEKQENKTGWRQFTYQSAKGEGGGARGGELVVPVGDTGIFEWVEERGTGVIPECESWLKRVAVDLYLDPITDFQNSNREENSFLITFGFENMIPE